MSVESFEWRERGGWGGGREERGSKKTANVLYISIYTSTGCTCKDSTSEHKHSYTYTHTHTHMYLLTIYVQKAFL